MGRGVRLTYPTPSPCSTFWKLSLTWKKRFRDCVDACAVVQSAWLLPDGRGCCWSHRPRPVLPFSLSLKPFILSTRRYRRRLDGGAREAQHKLTVAGANQPGSRPSTDTPGLQGVACRPVAPLASMTFIDRSQDSAGNESLVNKHCLAHKHNPGRSCPVLSICGCFAGT